MYPSDNVLQMLQFDSLRGKQSLMLAISLCRESAQYFKTIPIAK